MKTKTYFVNRDGLGDTNDFAAERYLEDLRRELFDVPVEWGASNTSDMSERYDKIAQSVWDRNIASYS